jgi:hypothetical protein
MKHSSNSVRQLFLHTLVLICLFNMPGGSTYNLRWPQSSITSASVSAENKSRASTAYAKLPLRFEANAGQTDPKVKFISRGSGYNLFLTPSEAVLALRNKKAKTAEDSQATVRMKLIGANPRPRVDGEEKLPGRSNYLIGNDPSKWRRNVASYGKVRYRSVYPGVDLIYYGNGQQLEYDFVVAAGADPNAIKLDFDGVRQIRMDRQGDLILDTGSGEVRHRKAVVYQEIDGRRQEIAGRYALSEGGEVSFEIGAYDRARPLVIDPVLSYATFLGSSGYDVPEDVAVDAAGNAYITGFTESVDFPILNPIQPEYAGRTDVFVTKLNRQGSALIFSTFLGGDFGDDGADIEVDRDGNICVTGTTGSTNFPTMNPLQAAYGGGVDGFVVKLNGDGSALIFSTFLGGSGIEQSFGLKVDEGGDIFVTGNTQSTNFPTMRPVQPANAGLNDAFVAKIKGDGSELIFSTYLGGRNSDVGISIAVDYAGNVYVAGSTYSTDFPTRNPLQAAIAGRNEAFLAKLDASGQTLLYSTYLGGTDTDYLESIGVDGAGNAYLMGVTYSTDFPTVNPLKPTLSGFTDTFVAKIDRTGSALLYSTYLGGTEDDEGSDMKVDPEGNAYITGGTTSIDFPTVDAAQPMPDPDSDTPTYNGNAFITKINSGGSTLIHSSLLGGKNYDLGMGIAVDLLGNVYVVGRTGSEDLPVTQGAFQSVLSPVNSIFDDSEIFIIKISDRGHR